MAEPARKVGNPNWLPGVSGNPLGKKKSTSLAEAIRQRFPVERIVDIAENLLASDDDRVVLATFSLIMDRGHGKVASVISATVSTSEDHIDVSSIPIEERRAMLSTAVKMTMLEGASGPDDTEH